MWLLICILFIPLNQAAKYLPGRPHRSTVWRLALRGSGGVRLRSVVSGSRRFTTLQWIQEYVAARTIAANKPVKNVTSQVSSGGSANSTTIINQDHEAAIEKQLDSLGICIGSRRPRCGKRDAK